MHNNTIRFRVKLHGEMHISTRVRKFTFREKLHGVMNKYEFARKLRVNLQGVMRKCKFTRKFRVNLYGVMNNKCKFTINFM